MINTETRRISKRFVMCIAACAMVWYFLNTHRAWVWAYFETLMLTPHPTPEMSKLAEASISAVTTVAIAGISAISAIALFLVTGNVAALSSMFKFNAVTQAAASVTSHSESVLSKHEEVIREYSERYRDDSSYRPLDTLPDKDGEDFR